jgi:hypothetical protein
VRERLSPIDRFHRQPARISLLGTGSETIMKSGHPYYQVALGIGVGTVLFVATLLVWLLVTEPVALAAAVGGEDLSELANAVSEAIINGLEALAHYL